jgi:hypothetical protein
LDNITACSGSGDWSAAWNGLLHFTNAASGIAYTHNSIAFNSKDDKSRFYELFNYAINSYLHQDSGHTSSVDYDGIRAIRAVEHSVCRRAGIAQIRYPQMLMEYVHEPNLALAKALFGTFMLLVQSQASVKTLNEMVSSVLQAHIADLNRYLFETWLCFAFIDYLHPVEFRIMVLDDNGELETRRAESLEVGYQTPLKDYRLPEASFRTSKGACYAYKFENSNEIAYYTTPNKCKDVTAAGSTSGLVCHRSLLLYRIDGLDTVPVLARRSFGYSLSPELMVEHLSEAEYSSKAVLSQVRKRPLLFAGNVPLHIVLRERSIMGPVKGHSIPHPLSVYRLGYEGHDFRQVLMPLL